MGLLPGPGVPDAGGRGHLCRAALHIYGQPAHRPDQRASGRKLDPGAAAVLARFRSAASSSELLYYGDILPNTYYLKLTGMPLASRLQSGLGFTSLYLITHVVLPGRGAGGRALNPTAGSSCISCWSSLPILYQIWMGGDPVRIWRMMTPAQPAAAVLFALSAWRSSRKGGSLSAPSGRRLRLVII